MSIIEELTPTHYQPTRVALQEQAGQIIATADIAIFNAAGQQIAVDNPDVALTGGERATFLQWFTAKIAAYEAAVGLLPYEAPS